MSTVKIEKVIIVKHDSHDSVFRVNDVVLVLLKSNDNIVGRIESIDSNHITLDNSSQFTSSIIGIDTNTISTIEPYEDHKEDIFEDIKMRVASVSDAVCLGAFDSAEECLEAFDRGSIESEGIFYTVLIESDESIKIFAVERTIIDGSDEILEVFDSTYEFLIWIMSDCDCDGPCDCAREKLSRIETGERGDIDV